MAQTGCEWIVDAAGCSSEKLCCGQSLRALCNALIAELDLHVVGAPQWHQFPPPGGWTGMYLLTESHLTIHTFPEHGQATLNLYCCRQRKEWDWEGRLEELLGATMVKVTCVERGRMQIAEVTMQIKEASKQSAICNPQSEILFGAAR
jgi:S-adenosylmethionine decarboxylase